MTREEQIKEKLKEVFMDAIEVDPFEKDANYYDNIYHRFILDDLDIVDLVMKMERYFYITLSEIEIENMKTMNIDKIVDFMCLKCSK